MVEGAGGGGTPGYFRWRRVCCMLHKSSTLFQSKKEVFRSILNVLIKVLFLKKKFSFFLENVVHSLCLVATNSRFHFYAVKMKR